MAYGCVFRQHGYQPPAPPPAGPGRPAAASTASSGAALPLPQLPPKGPGGKRGKGGAGSSKEEGGPYKLLPDFKDAGVSLHVGKDAEAM